MIARDYIVRVDVTLALFWIVSLVGSGIFHEQAHARVALWLGDTTARDQDRLSWDPRKHLDPWMSFVLPAILLLLTAGRFAYGGMKPVPINALQFRNPALGMALSAAAGPLSNVLLAVAGFLVLWLFWTFAPSFVYGETQQAITLNGLFLCVFTLTNLSLAAFNLLPLPGLDGSRVLYYFLGRDGRAFLDRIEPYALGITMLVVFSFPAVARGPIQALFHDLLRALCGDPFYVAFHQRYWDR